MGKMNDAVAATGPRSDMDDAPIDLEADFQALCWSWPATTSSILI